VLVVGLGSLKAMIPLADEPIWLVFARRHAQQLIVRVRHHVSDLIATLTALLQHPTTLA
jgi:hypothetical protein